MSPRAAPDPAPARDPPPGLPWEENTGHASHRRTRTSHHQPQSGPVAARDFLQEKVPRAPWEKLSPADAPPGRDPAPGVQEQGGTTGEGLGRAELLATPADTNPSGTKITQNPPENSTTPQEGPADPPPQEPALQTCPSVHSAAQQHLVHESGSAKTGFNISQQPDPA